MRLHELVDQAVETGDQTVPDALLGCWRRNWIQVGGLGTREREVSVMWVQTASGMGDVRIDPRQHPTDSDSSCGITVVDESAQPHMTADWLDGDSGFSQQAVPSYPEKGWLVWDSPTLMRELAPSGAYVEEWQLLPGSQGVIAHYIATNSATTTNLYVAGAHVLLAVQRQAGQLLDEFSYGVHSPANNTVIIELSTDIESVGSAMQFEHDWRLVSCRLR